MSRWEFLAVLSLRELETGDLIRNRTTGQAYTVSNIASPDKVIAVRLVEVANPEEWEVRRRTE